MVHGDGVNTYGHTRSMGLSRYRFWTKAPFPLFLQTLFAHDLHRIPATPITCSFTFVYQHRSAGVITDYSDYSTPNKNIAEQNTQTRACLTPNQPYGFIITSFSPGI